MMPKTRQKHWKLLQIVFHIHFCNREVAAQQSDRSTRSQILNDSNSYLNIDKTYRYSVIFVFEFHAPKISVIDPPFRTDYVE